MHTVQCRSCGGTVAHPAGAQVPRCLFCGRDALEHTESPGVEPPDSFLPFDLTKEAARKAFRDWSKRRFWAPRSIQRATLSLNPLFLPAWTWGADLETHWAALVPARTRSGSRPVTGKDNARIEGVLVPSSPTLAAAELEAISPFSEEREQSLGDSLPSVPFEIGTLTRAIAQERGVQQLRESHGARIAAALGSSKLSTSALVHNTDGRPLLLPIWIGAYVHGEKSYRVVINGQSGSLHGAAPISWWKVIGALVTGLFFLMLLLVVAASQ